MNDNQTPYEQRYAQALYRYTSALERGDIETVAFVLRDAEQDQHLEQLLLDANIMYQHEKSITISPNEIEQAQAVLLTTFVSHEMEAVQEDASVDHPEKLPVLISGHINTQKGRQQPMQTQDTTSAKPQKQQFSTRRPHLHHISTFLQTLAAVLVVGLLLSGFALLFASRHNTTTGSGIFGGGNGHITLSHSILVTGTDDGTIYGARPDTGAVAWHYSAGKSLSNSASTFTIHGQVVYFAAGSRLYALRTDNGTLLWHKNLDVPKALLANYSKIIVDQGIVFVSGQANGIGLPGGIIYALRERDGAILWQYLGGPDSLLTEHNGVVYAERVLDDHGNIAIQALRGSDGKYLWHYDTQVISVVADDTTVYVNSAHPLNVPGEIPGSKKQDKTLLALNTKGTLLWSKPVIDSGVSPLVIAHEVVILGGIDKNTYRACAYRTANGSQAWCTPNQVAPGASNVTSATITDDGVYYSYPTSLSNVALLVAGYNLNDGSPRWSAHFTEGVSFSPIVSMNKVVYVLTDHKIYALDASNGHMHWQLSNSTSMFTTFAVGSW